MKKYWIRFLLALQSELQYRVNLFMWMIVGAIGPFVMILVWFAVLNERPDVGGYGKSDFILYYLLTTFCWYIVGGEFSRPIGNSIRTGEINQSLLQPYSVVFGKAVWEQAWKLLSLLLSIPVFIAIIYLTRGYLDFSLHLNSIPYIVISLIGGAIIFALIQAIIGIIAFWAPNIWPFAEMNDMLLHLLGGMLAPIALLPKLVQEVSYFLPFRYIFYEPIAIILGKTIDPQWVLVRQGICILLLYSLYRLMWRAGIKRYEGTGG